MANLGDLFASKSVQNLNNLWKSDILTDAARARIMQEYNAGSKSEQILKTIDPDKDYKKDPEQAKRTRQQDQSRQIASTLTDALTGRADNYNQTYRDQFLMNQSPDIRSTPLVPQSHYLDQLSPQLQAQMAMYKGGLGDTDYQNVVKNFGSLLQEPEPRKPLSPADKWRDMQNQAIQTLPQGSPEWGKTMLPDVYPSAKDEWTEARQKKSQELEREKFEEGKKRTLEQQWKDMQAQQSMTQFSSLTPEQQKEFLFDKLFPDEKTMTPQQKAWSENWDKLTPEQQLQELYIHAFPAQKELSFKDQQVQANWDKLSQEQQLQYLYDKAIEKPSLLETTQQELLPSLSDEEKKRFAFKGALPPYEKPKTLVDEWNELKARERTAGFPALPEEAKQRELYPSAYRPTEGSDAAKWKEMLVEERARQARMKTREVEQRAAKKAELTPEERKKVDFPVLRTERKEKSRPIQVSQVPNTINKEFEKRRNELREIRKEDDNRANILKRRKPDELAETLNKNKQIYFKELRKAAEEIIDSQYQFIRNAGDDPNQIVGPRQIILDKLLWDIINEETLSPTVR